MSKLKLGHNATNSKAESGAKLYTLSAGVQTIYSRFGNEWLL